MNPKIIPMYNQPDECGLVRATVKGVSNESVMIDTGKGVVNARTAFSCLVAPENGDSVLVNYVENDYYILSVLERQEEQDMTLKFPADVKMQAMSGGIDMASNKDINLMTSAETNMMSGNLRFTSGNMDVTTGKLTTRTNDIESHSKTVRLYTHALDTVAKQMSQKTDILVRWVENVETLNIGNLIQRVRKNYTSHSDQAVITAQKDMRLDGERIHMG